MGIRRRNLVIGGCVLAVAAGGGGVAYGVGGDREAGATGPKADRAAAAALKVTGGGEANAVERDGENGATWEVEVTRTDGKTVDVRLDENYKLVVVESDQEDGPDGPDNGAGEQR